MSLEEERQRRLGAARRVVIKLGTSTVTCAQGDISRARVEPLAQSIAQLKSLGKQIVLVSSGAVGLGAGRLGLDRARLRDVVMRQACAAVGQSLLMHAYERIFSEHRVQIAQVLLTEGDFTDWHRYLNLQRTVDKLLRLGVLPIINENDTVSVAELEYLAGAERVFSDNDRLAALVMSKLEADTLVLLTDVDGLLMHDRKSSGEDERARELSAGAPKGAVIPLVEEITPELKAFATGPAAGGRGGMQTKLEAAQIAMRAGGIAVIANGHRPDTLTRIFAGEQIGTTFISTSRMAGKRRWIAYGASVRGRLIVNEGARDAITRGKASLLSSGVVRVEKQFAPHDVVSIADDEGREFARGIANCASEEASQFIESYGNGGGGGGVGATAGGDVGSGHHRKPFVLVTRNNIVLLEKDE